MLGMNSKSLNCLFSYPELRELAKNPGADNTILIVNFLPETIWCVVSS
jgi:hypothetical protein